MMHATHRVAMVVRALAAIGVACGLVWGLLSPSIITPLVMIPGSTEPGT